jgi:ABC-type transport system involved in multi-copper enzyme maturation permease subunit
MSAGAAVRAEWVKLRSVRSTTWALLALASFSVLFSALSCWESHTEGPGDNDLVLDSLSGIWFGQIAAAVLGVIVVTSEYSSGLIRATFAAVPRRRTVVVAKTVVVGVAVAIVGLATSVLCFVVGQPLLRGNGFSSENGYQAASLADGATLRAVAGSGIYLALLAIFAVGVGTVLRNTAGAITSVLALILGPVIAITFLPERVADLVERTALVAAGLSIQQTVERPGALPLGPWEGLGVVSAYAAVALLAGFWAIARRDA